MKKGVFKMSFKDLVTKSLRTNDQIKQEANDAENQANKYAAEYIVKLIKDDIITKADKAEYDANRISNIIHIPHDGSYSDDIPYGNIFEVKIGGNHKRSSGLFGFNWYDTDSNSFTVNNTRRLTIIFDMVEEIAKKDDIIVSKPFIICEIIDLTSKKVKEQKKTFICNNKLCATITTKKHGSMNNWKGEAANLYLAIEYQYSI